VGFSVWLAKWPFRNRLSRGQLLQQRLGLLQVNRVEAFGEPAVDRGEKIAGFAAPDDPPTCLIKLRTLAELVAKLIAAHHALYTQRWAAGVRETSAAHIFEGKPDGESGIIEARTVIKTGAVLTGSLDFSRSRN
jgi:hypothetical protein